MTQAMRLLRVKLPWLAVASKVAKVSASTVASTSGSREASSRMGDAGHGQQHIIFEVGSAPTRYCTTWVCSKHCVQ
jgi:hypothetical protein